jgi:hypothetical protein
VSRPVLFDFDETVTPSPPGDTAARCLVPDTWAAAPSLSAVAVAAGPAKVRALARKMD